MTHSIKAGTPGASSGFYEYGSKLPSFILRKPSFARMGSEFYLLTPFGYETLLTVFGGEALCATS